MRCQAGEFGQQLWITKCVGFWQGWRSRSKWVSLSALLVKAFCIVCRFEYEIRAIPKDLDLGLERIRVGWEGAVVF